MAFINKLAQILLIIGGLNWGLVGLFDFNLVTALFGTSVITSIIYILVGLSAIISIFSSVKTTQN